MEGMPKSDVDDCSPTSTDSVNSKSRKSYKSSFSIDSLLEKKLANGQPSESNKSSKSASLVSKPRQLPPPTPTASKFPLFDPPLRPFMAPLAPPPPNLGSLARWPFLHPPPPPPPNLSFAAVAPIWAMAAQAAAATGMVGTPGIPSFVAAASGVVMPAVSVGAGGPANDGRRPPTLNKAPPVKKYKCDVCSKAFSRSNTLVTHKVRLSHFFTLSSSAASFRLVFFPRLAFTVSSQHFPRLTPAHPRASNPITHVRNWHGGRC